MTDSPDGPRDEGPQPPPVHPPPPPPLHEEEDPPMSNDDIAAASEADKEGQYSREGMEELLRRIIKTIRRTHLEKSSSSGSDGVNGGADDGDDGDDGEGEPGGGDGGAAGGDGGGEREIPELSTVAQALAFITTLLKDISPWNWDEFPSITGTVSGHIEDSRGSTDGFPTVDISVTDIKLTDSKTGASSEYHGEDGGAIRIEMKCPVKKKRKKGGALEVCRDVTVSGILKFDNDNPTGFFEIHPQSPDDVVTEATASMSLAAERVSGPEAMPTPAVTPITTDLTASHPTRAATAAVRGTVVPGATALPGESDVSGGTASSTRGTVAPPSEGGGGAPSTPRSD